MISSWSLGYQNKWRPRLASCARSYAASLRCQPTLVNPSVARLRGSRVREQLEDCQEENDQYMDLIHAQSHFNFIKMHLIFHFCEHIYQFGNIPMNSTEYGEPTDMEQIKDGYWRSNKIDAVRQILRRNSRYHATRMRLLNFEFLWSTGADLLAEVVGHLEKRRTLPVPPAYCRILKRGLNDICDIADFSRVSDVSLETICRELILYRRLSLPLGRRLPEDLVVLRSLPVELKRTLGIPVLAFQETHVDYIHLAWCTGSNSSITRWAGMEVFGYRLVVSRCMVHLGGVSQRSS